MTEITRRTLLRALSAVSTQGCAQHLWGQEPAGSLKQGMSTRRVQPAPRGKPSGLPFSSRFTDVAQLAGLKDPVICGRPDRADYVVDAMGCGVAFVDFDNDGWV